jgi:hypothetical protein
MWPLLRVFALPSPTSCPPILTACKTLKLHGHSADTRPHVPLSERSLYGNLHCGMLDVVMKIRTEGDRGEEIKQQSISLPKVQYEQVGLNTGLYHRY